MNDYFTFFYVKHFELPLCMKCAIQINLPCLAYMMFAFQKWAISTSCFSEKTFLSLIKWMVSKGGGHVLEQHLGFADGYGLFGCLSFFPINVSVA